MKFQKDVYGQLSIGEQNRGSKVKYYKKTGEGVVLFNEARKEIVLI